MSKPKIWMTFIGAAGNQVTGSGTVLVIEHKNKISQILIDVGLAQGEDEYRNSQYPVKSEKLDAVLITHAHADHFLALPLLRDFHGKIYATANTLQLGSELLYDAAFNNERNACTELGITVEAYRSLKYECENILRRRANSASEIERYRELTETLSEIKSTALYTMDDVVNIQRHFRAIPLYTDIKLFAGITARFIPSTHQNGATSIELYVGDYMSDSIGLAFSGDIGPKDSFLYQNHSYLPNPRIKYFVAEALHGVEDKPQSSKQAFELCEKIILNAEKSKKTVIFTAFALDRSAKVIKTINDIIDKHNISMDIYLDSPLAFKELMHYQEAYRDAKDEYFKNLGSNPFDISEFIVTNKGIDHLQALYNSDPKIVITASAMGYGGRVVDYFAHDIQRDDVIFVFCGYLIPDCPSDVLHNAEKGEIIEIHGAHYVKHCETVRLDGFSSHGYFPELIDEINKFPRLNTLILNHAERESKEAIKEKLSEMYSFNIIAPEMFDEENQSYFEITPTGMKEVNSIVAYEKFESILG